MQDRDRAFGCNWREFPSVYGEVLLQFPGMDGAAIALVLRRLRLAEGMVDVIAERAADDRVAIELRQRFAQRMRELPNAALGALALAKLVRAAGKRLARQQLVADAVQAGRKHDG